MSKDHIGGEIEMQDNVTEPKTSPVADNLVPVEVLPIEERKSTRFMLSGLKKGIPASDMQSLMTEKGVSEQDISDSTDYVSAVLQEKAEEKGWDVEEAFQMAGFDNIPAQEVVQPDGQEIGLPPVKLNFEEELEAQQDKRDIAAANNFLSVPKEDRIASGVIDPSKFELNMLSAALEHKNELLSPVLLAQSLAGDVRAKARVEQYKENLSQVMSAGFNRYGIESQVDGEGNVMVQLPESGDWVKADTGVIDQIGPQLLVNGLAIGASIVAGSTAFTRTPGPFQLKATVAAGASALAAGGGRALDVFKNNIFLRDDIDYQHLRLQMVNEAYYDAIFGVAGGIIAESGVKGLKAIKEAKEKILGGNMVGGKEVLAKGLSTDEAGAEMMASTLRDSIVSPRQAGANADVAEAVLLAKTHPEGAPIIKAAMDEVGSSAFQIAKETTERVKQFKDAASGELPKSLNSTLIQNIKDYTVEVTSNYGRVVGAASKVIDAKDYSFDFEKLVNVDMDAYIQKNIRNDTKRQQAESILSDAQVLGEAGGLRSFNNLIELRKLVNTFDAKDVPALTKVKANIDAEIKKATTKFMGEDAAKAWQEAFGIVNVEWGKLKNFEVNKITKAIQADPTNEQVVNFLYSKAGVTQASGVEVKQFMSALPAQARKVVEMSVLNKVIDDFTVGAKKGTRALYLPEAAAKIKDFDFFSKEAQSFKEVLTRFADVFAGDVELARNTGTVKLQANQTYLTPNPATRVLMMGTNMWMRHVKKFGNSDEAKWVALASKMGKLLDEPLKHASVQDVLRTVSAEDKPAMEMAIKDMQKAFVQQGQKDTFPRVASVSKSSDPGKRVDGPVGVARYFDAAAKGSAARTRQYDPNSFADLDVLRFILDDPNPTAETVRKNRTKIDKAVKARNYIGFMWKGSFVLP